MKLAKEHSIKIRELPRGKECFHVFQSFSGVKKKKQKQKQRKFILKLTIQIRKISINCSLQDIRS